MANPDTADPREAALREALTAWLAEELDTPASYESLRLARVAQDWLATEPSAGVTSEAAEPCWFCGRKVGIDNLIAGYDTWDEQRLACLDCDRAIHALYEKGWLPADERRATPSTSTETPTRVVGGGERLTAEEKADWQRRIAMDFASLFIRIRGAHNGPDHPTDPDTIGEPCSWCRLAAEQAAEAVVKMATGIGMDGRIRGLLAATTPVPSVSDEGLRAALEAVAHAWRGSTVHGEQMEALAKVRAALSSEPVR